MKRAGCSLEARPGRGYGNRRSGGCFRKDRASIGLAIPSLPRIIPPAGIMLEVADARGRQCDAGRRAPDPMSSVRDAAASSATSRNSISMRGSLVAPGQLVAIDGVIIGDPPDTTTVSYSVSGLCSPFVSSAKARSAMFRPCGSATTRGCRARRTPISARCSRRPAAMSRSGERSPTDGRLSARRGPRRRGDPTLAADIRGNRIYWTIRGWGTRGESWLIDHGEWGLEHGEGRLGRPGRAGDGADRRHAVAPGHDQFRFPAGRNRTANRPDLDFARRFPRIVRATKGSSQPMLGKPIVVSKPEVTRKARRRNGRSTCTGSIPTTSKARCTKRSAGLMISAAAGICLRTSAKTI